ncbi:hypothetical protein BDEG_27007 [Batrachochytrium dendrobatidis JEL423]|uniref:DNA replication complex GINS protein PSF3 n=1 Tax=Batrachochytrium dendrobatidis (strain JEL423) TaxID=403673 RepID=A0A177WU90_BATDL|nr:hypothetical protein BDEG_27007 [Batrachochytrium dendrobatidis JEL423]
MCDYWDLNTILAEQTKVRCHVKLPAYGYSFLAGAKDDSLLVNSIIDIPFWMGKPLALQAVVDLEIPTCFSDAVQDELLASPVCVKISLHCPFFFKFFADLLGILV